VPLHILVRRVLREQQRRLAHIGAQAPDLKVRTLMQEAAGFVDKSVPDIDIVGQLSASPTHTLRVQTGERLAGPIGICRALNATSGNLTELVIALGPCFAMRCRHSIRNNCGPPQETFTSCPCAR
jgi:hypothetical protein